MRRSDGSPASSDPPWRVALRPVNRVPTPSQQPQPAAELAGAAASLRSIADRFEKQDAPAHLSPIPAVEAEQHSKDTSMWDRATISSSLDLPVSLLSLSPPTCLFCIPHRSATIHLRRIHSIRFSQLADRRRMLQLEWLLEQGGVPLCLCEPSPRGRVGDGGGSKLALQE
jgi:hypothetical protein